MEHLSLLLLLLLPFCSSQINENYAGTAMTYYSKYNYTDGSVTVDIRFKSNSIGCWTYLWSCLSPDCGTIISRIWYLVDYDAAAQFCQRETVRIIHAATNAPFQLYYLWTSDHYWIKPIANAVRNIKALTLVELRNRSDTGQINRPPLTTIPPIFRVPWNCQTNIKLLVFDPDGDLVKCRFADNSINSYECFQCTPPSVLNLSPTCTLSFSPTDNSTVGRYAVQMMMEDFPRTNMILTQNNGAQESKTTTDTISKIPLQFVFSVEAAAPSCSEGLYLPRFVEPTPEHGAQLNVNVSQTLQITIKAEANVSTVSDVRFSGPHTMTKVNSGGQYVLSWMPSMDEDGNSYPVCFIAEGDLNSTKYESALRCVVVMVGDASIIDTSTTTTPPALTTTPVISTTTNITPTSTPSSGTETTTPKTEPSIKVFMKTRISSTVSLSEDDLRTTVIQQFREELVKRGLPSDATLKLINSTSTATPGGSP